MSLRELHRAFERVIREYLEALQERARDPDATDELSLRPALDVLILKGIPEVFGREELQITSEPLRRSFGTPDYKLKTAKGFLIGYVEAEGLSDDLDNLPSDAKEQVERFRKAGLRFLLTNHLDFVLYDYASDGKTVVPVSRASLLDRAAFERGRGPERADVEALYRLFERFLKEARPDIGTPKELAERLAASARHIRDQLLEAYEAEGERGELHDLKAAFEKTLIPDLTPEQFADMYAQTLTYGLFAAAVNHRGPEPLTLDNAWRDIPKTNPFLRTLFESVTGSALEGKPYQWVIEDLVHLLNALDMGAILEAFGKRAAQQDPVVHFYEDFLAEYDPELREKRGVYYTPEPVVSYIVRSVDYLLKDKFGCPEGLADPSRITYTVKRNNEEHDEESHKVLILDPACGTGTFLYFVIDLIRERFKERGEAGMWRDYVKEHLLPRIFGFELLMAPYAMAHLKLGMQLAGLDLPEEQRKDWAYTFEADERLGIYLTNTLEEPRPREIPLYGPLRVITEEANAASRVKQDLPILVVLGNPPYSNFGRMNQGEWILTLMKEWKPVSERKWNPDDFMKFIRWAQWRIERTGAGILAFITNHTYLDGLTHRRMRQSLMKTFTDIYILNLHGNKRKGERAPDGSPDDNVFDIRQGVAIGIFVKEPTRSAVAKVHYAELWGSRDFKYARLLETSLETTKWTDLRPKPELFFFVRRADAHSEEYANYVNLGTIFPINGSGFTTHRDHFVIDFDLEQLQTRIMEYYDLSIPDDILRGKYNISDYRAYRIKDHRRKTSIRHDVFVQCIYRPFDKRWIYYAKLIVQEWQFRFQQHMLRDNVALIAMRQVSLDQPFNHVFITDAILNDRAFLSARGRANIFPLYLYPPARSGTSAYVDRGRVAEELRKAVKQAGGDEKAQNRALEVVQKIFPKKEYARWPNFHPDFLAELSERLGLDFVPDGRGDSEKTFGPEDVFHYIYAVLHSPTYRERYKEFLKIDFPRIPLTSNLELFRALCQKGADLVALHLLERDYEAASWNVDKSKPNPFDNIQVRYPVPGEDVVEKGHPKYVAPGEKAPGSDEPLEEGRVYISAEKPKKGKRGQYFEGVPPEVWGFHVGGYQVCEKWLKDRRGRKLSYEDKEHYKKIVMALGETIRLMQEIDEVIEQHGGWPIT